MFKTMIGLFKKLTIHKQMENTNLSIEEIKLILNIIKCFCDDYYTTLKKIDDGHFMFPSILFATPEQLKEIKERVKGEFVKNFQNRIMMAESTIKKLKEFIKSVS